MIILSLSFLNNNKVINNKTRPITGPGILSLSPQLISDLFLKKEN